MEIKPIKLVAPVSQADVGQIKNDRARPSPTQLVRAPEGKWQFVRGMILHNGQDVAHILENENSLPPAFWSKLANDLNQFRNYTIAERLRRRRKKWSDKENLDDVDPSGELGHLSALVDAYIAKIMRQLKRRYDETADGISYTLDEEGQLTLNGINVNSFVEMATQNYSSDKAKLFLKGLKNRLGVILSNKRASANYDKIRDITEKMMDRIDEELTRIGKDRLLENG